jgi:hypothetical protein
VLVQWRSARGESYVNDLVGNSAGLSGRYHCDMDGRAWIELMHLIEHVI